MIMIKPEASQNGISVAIETHGCKLNQADSQQLSRRFIEKGCEIVSSDQHYDIYVLNTCTVTHVADAKARQRLRSVRKTNPNSYIVATGCYAQRDKNSISEINEVDLIVGNTGKDSLVDTILSTWDFSSKELGSQHIGPHLNVGKVRSMLKIQEGCNQVCAYCIVPKVRGRERSIPATKLVEDINSLVRKGFREVVLTGTQLGSYGFDLVNFDLTKLIKVILDHTDVERLRVSSLQPQELTERLIRLWDDKRICPHFHIPMQSGSDKILQVMRRRYTAKEYLDAVERIRNSVPHASITADVIIGFPGESEEDFNETFELCRMVSFANIHLFRYSLRPGTSAYYLDSRISDNTKRKRMSLMTELVHLQKERFWNNQLGQICNVLWESTRVQYGKPYWSGLTETYIPVQVQNHNDLLNSITPVKLVGLHSEGMKAVLLYE